MKLGHVLCIRRIGGHQTLFQSCSRFLYCTIKKMLEKFPFNESILRDLGIINPEHRTVSALLKNLLNDFLNETYMCVMENPTSGS